jgi:phosphoglycerate dehydrogenase-like enzyme
MTLRCAILDDYQNVAATMADWSPLDGRVQIETFCEHIDDEEALAAALKDHAIVVAMRERTPFRESLLARLPALKLLITTGMGNASFDMAAAAARGIVVCGTRGIEGSAAELTWALLMALVRHIPEETANLRGAGALWQRTVGTDLAGKTLGVVGLGRLGSLVARYAQAFGMNVIGRARGGTAASASALGIAAAGSLDELLAAADIVTLHVKLTAETRGMIGARELGLMKPGALLVNTSRGPLVDEAAMVAALQSGALGGAALDVFDQEPLPADHPLRTLPNVVATPHVGYVTHDTYRMFYGDAVADIAAWLDDAPVRVLNGAA